MMIMLFTVTAAASLMNYDAACCKSQVGRPKLGEVVPRSVDCTVTIDIARCSGDIRAEWEALRDRDVVFLVCIRNPQVNAVQQILEAEKLSHHKGRPGNVTDGSSDADRSID